VIQEVVRLDNVSLPTMAEERPGAITGSRAIYSIWPDFAVQALLTKSAVTVKADAARAAFAAFGEDIVWAVVDSGIDERHPHFKQYDNLKLGSGLQRAHHDFTRSAGGALRDTFGHGTHVAGIVAGAIDVMPM